MKNILYKLLVLCALLCVGCNVVYIIWNAPHESYPEDRFLSEQKDKNALIIVAHDDDAVAFSGLISKLTSEGWEVSFVCFYGHWKPEEFPTRKNEVARAAEIQHIKNIETIDFSFWLKDTDAVWMPIPYKDFPVKMKTDSILYFVERSIAKYHPSVIFTLDNIIGGYGHPEHIVVSRSVIEVCRKLKQDSKFSVKKIYQGVLPPKQRQHLMNQNATYLVGKKIYNCSGMPDPNFQIEISKFGVQKKETLDAYESQYRNLKHFFPFYQFYPASFYFRIFNKEFYKVIDINEII